MAQPSQLDRAQALVNTLYNTLKDPTITQALTNLQHVVDEAQNGPPDGDADGSIDETTWKHLRDTATALNAAMTVIHTFIEEAQQGPWNVTSGSQWHKIDPSKPLLAQSPHADPLALQPWERKLAKQFGFSTREADLETAKTFILTSLRQKPIKLTDLPKLAAQAGTFPQYLARAMWKLSDEGLVKVDMVLAELRLEAPCGCSINEGGYPDHRPPCPKTLPRNNPADPHCHANREGDCDWKDCPQLRDNEPYATRRSCPRTQYEDGT